ncbi:MAG TPA: RcpC/CpaB family pilus assembly protein [Egibacteraceae bacterium]|nr:RcpC/CpaB family pilus assembly protein [Egibacteraceae bacterium]
MAVLDPAAAPPRLAPEPVVARRLPHRRLSAGHVIMLLAGLLALVLNFSLLRARDASVRVAVAATPLHAGQPVAARSFAFTDVTVDDAQHATLLGPERLEAVQGWVAATEIAPGELIRLSDLRPPSAPAAQRAMSIPVEPEHAVGGDLRPGDRVDVIDVTDSGADYVVADAQVLAVARPDPGPGLGGLRTFSVTIAVDDQSALQLATAIRNQSLEIVRSTGATHVGASSYRRADDPGAVGTEPSTGRAG